MDGDMAGVSHLLPFTSSPYKVAPVPTSTSVSSMSMSYSRSKGKGSASTTTTVPKVAVGKHLLQSSSDGSGGLSPDARKKVRGLSQPNDAEEGGEDDKDSDYIAVTNGANGNVVEGGGIWGDGSNH